MIELIKYVIGMFSEKPEEVQYDIEENGKNVSVTVTLSSSDMGKVIGRQGKIAKAMRTIVRAATPASSKRYVIEIRERGGETVDTDTDEN